MLNKYIKYIWEQKYIKYNVKIKMIIIKVIEIYGLCVCLLSANDCFMLNKIKIMEM